MTYDTIFARSFSKHDQKKLGCGAFVGCLIILVSICTVFKPYLGPLPVLNFPVSLGVGLKMLMTREISQPYQIDIQTKVVTEETKGIISKPRQMDTQKKEVTEETQEIISKPHQMDIQTKELAVPEEISKPNQTDIQRKEVVVKPICNISGQHSDACEMAGDIRIHGSSSTVFVPITDDMTNFPENGSWSIRPYARKEDKTAMGSIQEFTVKTVNIKSSSQDNSIPQCTHNHSVPSIVFSTSGYCGNHFHDFTDVVIPLYLTSREFNGQVQFLVTNKQSFWIHKYRQLLQKLSNYEIIDIDREVGVHCFPKMIVGLKHHKEFDIDPSRSPYSMKDFREFLRDAYSLKREKIIKIRGKAKRPRLLIISRRRTRSFMNEGEIIKMARGSGFEVVVAEADSNLGRFSRLVNSCDVMMGVHGAGLTNIVFLPENAVFIQIVPFGRMEWIANNDFGEPAKDMNLSYIEYKISEEESSLIQEYPLDHPVFKDPYSISKKGWVAFREVYLDKQNVKLDVGRFRATLLEAQKLLHQ